jgi:lipopolysaccharide heptosyltransferase II
MIIDKRKIKRILCIKLKGIGDVVLSTGAVKNLRLNFPEAEIDFLTEPASKPILEFNPDINEVLLFRKKEKFSSVKVIAEVYKKNYNMVVDFYSNPRTALITYFSFANYRLGFPYKGRSYAYNLKGPAERTTFHNAELQIELLKENGINITTKELFVGENPEDALFASEYFSRTFTPGMPVIGISPSGGWPSKKCDPKKFAEIADRAAEKYKAEFLIVWGPGDKTEANEIHRLMKNKSALAPETGIGQMASLMKRCALMIANDSGPMHISSAIGTPTLSIHGPTSPRMQGPYGKKHEWVWNDKLDCIECNLLECPRQHECFLQLDTEKVIEKIDILIKKNNIKIEQD